jgi:protein involved in polysaccharide export with SLBB domain
MPARINHSIGGAGTVQRWLFVFISLWFGLGAMGSLAQDDGYTLNSGDSIRIHVYGEPDLTFAQLLIGQSGRISYPFLGELRVAGSTVNELQELLVGKLKPDYLVDPRVSVGVVRYRQFYVNGEVKSPGGVDFQPGLTLRKAISLAGGFTERANRKKILVIANSDPNRKEQEVSLAYQVQPGDIFTVQDTFF